MHYSIFLQSNRSPWQRKFPTSSRIDQYSPIPDANRSPTSLVPAQWHSLSEINSGHCDSKTDWMMSKRIYLVTLSTVSDHRVAKQIGKIPQPPEVGYCGVISVWVMRCHQAYDTQTKSRTAAHFSIALGQISSR